MKSYKTVSVTGACGRLAYNFLFQLASGNIFGHDTMLNINIIDLPHNHIMLEGIKMELEDTCSPYINSIKTFTDIKGAFADADWCVLIGAAPRQAGMERADLLLKNAAIFDSQGNEINKTCHMNTKVLIVGNPCNTNAMIVNNNTPNLSPNNIYAMMTLDENRAKAILAMHLRVSTKDISDVVIYGNHSKTMYPDLTLTKVKGESVWKELDKEWVSNTFIPTVQNRGADIIKYLGRSSAGSAASAAADFIRLIESENTGVFSVGRISTGEYGSKPGTCFSMPCRKENGKLVVQHSHTHSESAQTYITASIDEINRELDILQEIM